MGVRLVKASTLLPSQGAIAGEPDFPFGLASDGVHEVAEVSYRDCGAATGFALAAAEKAGAKAVLWITARRQLYDRGALVQRWAEAGFAPSFEAVLHVQTTKKEESFWAIEEALYSRAVSLVLAETEAPDFTLSRRLSLASSKTGVPVLLLTPAATEGTTAAQGRWRIKSMPSLHNPFDPKAPGMPIWQATLERSRTAPSQVGRRFLLRGDHEPLSLHQAERLAPQPLAPQPQAPLPFRRAAS